MDTTIIRMAPAKINLYLEISGRRSDGYHDIESVMQTVTLFDKLTFTKHDSGGECKIELTCTEPSIPCDERNLVYKAARAFFEAAEIGDYRVSVTLEKHIPHAAGLGGGSADAAATLTALNELYGAGLSTDVLCRTASRLGADVPFCVVGGIAVARGIGDILEPCPSMPDCYIVVACGSEGVSTPWAYGRLDEMYDFSDRNVSADAFVELLATKDLSLMSEAMTNIFESAVLPEREAARIIKDTMLSEGAVRAMMSGSGPSIIGIFTDVNKAESARQKLIAAGAAANVCKPFYPEA